MVLVPGRAAVAMLGQMRANWLLTIVFVAGSTLIFYPYAPPTAPDSALITSSTKTVKTIQDGEVQHAARVPQPHRSNHRSNVLLGSQMALGGTRTGASAGLRRDTLPPPGDGLADRPDA